MPRETKKEFKYEIVKDFGTLSTSPKGWNRMVRLVSWNDARPKLDIRDWSPDNSSMGKGISLSPDEVNTLKAILEDYDPYENV